MSRRAAGSGSRSHGSWSPLMGGDVELESAPGRTVVRVGSALRRRRWPRPAGRRRFHVKTEPSLPVAACVRPLLSSRSWRLRSAPGRALVGSPAGWIGDGRKRETVFVGTAPSARPGRCGAVDPLLGNGFDPARSTPAARQASSRSTPFFGGGSARRARASSSRTRAMCSPTRTSSRTAGEGNDGPRRVARLRRLRGRRPALPATIVGWDLFNDIGVIKVDPRDHVVSPLPLGDSAASSSASRSPRSEARSGRRTRSRSASSRRFSARSPR